MFETSVQMRFSFKKYNIIEMMVINVGINSKESFEYGLDYLLKMRRKFNSNFGGKKTFVLNLIFNPGH